ncbi:MAG TPA: DUF4339 domain-containing protein [Verrucomicrobiae bacterium]
MISLPDYKVMGEDGQEYGPVSDDQIRKWIAEGRLERKSPVKSGDSHDWVFLESLPEFANVFQPPAAPPPKPQKRKWLLVLIIVVIAGLLFVALKKFNHH